MPVRLTLEHVPRDRPVSIILRHAERDPIRSYEEGWEARLTDNGHRDAAALGRTLVDFASMRLWSSPIPRCQQTANRLAEGLRDAGSDVDELVVINDLAGPYLHDAEKVLKIALDIGDRAFVRRWFEGDLASEHLMPSPRAATGQLMVLTETLATHDEPGLYVHCSHDWNILLLREHFLGIRHEDAGMPDFLEGLATWRDGHDLVVQWRDNQHRMRWRRLAESAE